MGLLALLETGPSHGYELKAAFETGTGGVWALNVGQVYSTLERLAKDGLVEPVEGGARYQMAARERHLWRITRDGKDALATWFDAPAVDETPPRDELLVKVLLALGRSPREALAVIDRQRTHLFTLLRNLRSLQRPADASTNAEPMTALAGALMDEARIARHEADLRWLQRAEEALVSLPAAATRTADHPPETSGEDPR